MHNSCKTIVFTGIASTITIITTWLIATSAPISQLLGNAEVKQFALTVSGGLFTGFFVMMLSEAHRYRNLKRDTETYAFFQTLYLYQALYEMKSNTLGALDHPATDMLGSFFEESARKIQAELSAIQSIEYDPFINGEDSLANTINGFRREIPQHMSTVVQMDSSLKVAVSNMQISNVEKTGHKDIVHAGDSVVREALTKTISILDGELKRVDELATAIDSYCNSRYNWSAFKTSIQQNCKSIYELGYGDI